MPSPSPTELQRSDVIGPDGYLLNPCQIFGKLLDGPCVVFRENGLVLLEITYLHGVPHGPFRDYWLNGQLGSEGEFNNGKLDGIWKYAHLDGSVEERRYVEGLEISTLSQP
jgi:hypothetical protein